MVNKVVEVVTFKLMPGVSDADYVAATRKTDGFIRNMRGFIDRRLSKGGDGVWMDYVIWTDMAAAQEAGAKFPQMECTADVMRMIDPATLVMRHEAQMWVAEPDFAMG
ncbi:hypothetical protein [Arenibacterium sp. LLYu02]|uniref:hypothetical protein n=1 Tax=Arenibacterium sp. LLYu02 TaxID=3404132 RepID=UPI003B2278F2